METGCFLILKSQLLAAVFFVEAIDTTVCSVELLTTSVEWVRVRRHIHTDEWVLVSIFPSDCLVRRTCRTSQEFVLSS